MHGDDHHLTITAKLALARIWHAQDRGDEAMAMLQDCIRRTQQQQSCREDHPLTMVLMGILQHFEEGTGTY